MSGPVAGPAPTPSSGIVGFGAARKELARTKHDERRALLEALVVQVGVRGAPAMEYSAKVLRWIAEAAPAPVAPERLTSDEVRFCERRVRELLEPYLEVGDYRLPDDVRRRYRAHNGTLPGAEAQA